MFKICAQTSNLIIYSNSILEFEIVILDQNMISWYQIIRYNVLSFLFGILIETFYAGHIISMAILPIDTHDYGIVGVPNNYTT